MSLMDWLRKRLAGDESAKLELGKDEESLSGLNLNEVLNAHLAWKDRLGATLAGTSSEKLQIAQVAVDNLCVLGKWLHGAGKQEFGQLPEFAALVETHRKFHLTAGEVLVEHESGHREHAQSVLQGEFRTQSNRIQLDLVRLFAKAKHKA